MGLAQDIRDALDRHVPVEAVERAPPQTRAHVQEAQNLRVEMIDLAELLENSLRDRPADAGQARRP
jgi:hypothetical protein